ncbi:MAG: hypothetical protein L0Z07_08180 [Planctomycetes bacterium]|nr:hypothetical protein [Planctomycetota bacterium]
MTLTIPWNWQKLFSYGEVMCFISAWAVGLLVAWGGHRTVDTRVATRSFQSTPDVPGIQAALGKFSLR